MSRRLTNGRRNFCRWSCRRYANRLHLYEGKEPLFHKYKLDEEISRINQRQVPLKGGGSLVIDQTEALVAIDVNQRQLPHGRLSRRLGVQVIT